jgi:hypothetical protein
MEGTGTFRLGVPFPPLHHMVRCYTLKKPLRYFDLNLSHRNIGKNPCFSDVAVHGPPAHVSPDLAGSLHHATTTDTPQRPDMQHPLRVDSEPSKTWPTPGGVEQKGSDDAMGYTVAEGAWQNIDFHGDAAPQLETANVYGVRLPRPFSEQWGVNRVCVLDRRYAGQPRGNRAHAVK